MKNNLLKGLLLFGFLTLVIACDKKKEEPEDFSGKEFFAYAFCRQPSR